MKIKKVFVLVLIFLIAITYYSKILSSTALANELNFSELMYQQPYQEVPVYQQKTKSQESTSTNVRSTVPKEQESLKNFIKNTKQINASFTYPSMPVQEKKITSFVLPAHTPVILRNMTNVSTDNIMSGSNVDFLVMSDVKDRSGNILIKAGTPATAQIVFAKQTGGNLGKAGKLEISDFHTTAVDGGYVPLSGTLSSQGEDRMVLSIVLSVVICPLFLLMDGDTAMIPVGTTKTVYTVSDIYITP